MRDEEEEEESGQSEEGEAEIAPVIRLQTRKRHPFVKLLLALWPFGESFKELGLLGKIYEICKVCGCGLTV